MRYHQAAELSQQLQAVLHAAVEDGVMDVNNAASLQQLLWLIEAPAPDPTKVIRPVVNHSLEHIWRRRSKYGCTA